tara:strand:+ start:688 stop:1158 length:471 start_codon:yes stop_codon:yes gene_type:complete
MTMWAKQNQYRTKTEELIELFLIGATCFVLGFVFFYDYEDEPSLITEPSVNEFEQYPLQAWPVQDVTGGDAIKIKYRVDRDNTCLYMRNSQGKLVHKTPLSLDPFNDGRERIETYVWKLYRTEWTSKIPPGEYQIIVGTTYDKDPTRNLNIEIDIE